MNKQEAAKLLGVSEFASLEQVEAAFEKIQSGLEAKIASAPTPALKNKLRQKRKDAEQAFGIISVGVSDEIPSTSPKFQETHSKTEVPAVNLHQTHISQGQRITESPKFNAEQSEKVFRYYVVIFLFISLPVVPFFFTAIWEIVVRDGSYNDYISKLTYWHTLTLLPTYLFVGFQVWLLGKLLPSLHGYSLFAALWSAFFATQGSLITVYILRPAHGEALTLVSLFFIWVFHYWVFFQIFVKLGRISNHFWIFLRSLQHLWKLPFWVFDSFIFRLTSKWPTQLRMFKK